MVDVVGLERVDLPSERGVVDCALPRWARQLGRAPCRAAIDSIYGMNFKYMPELEWSFGYPAVLLLMPAICVTLYFVFRLGRVVNYCKGTRNASPGRDD